MVKLFTSDFFGEKKYYLYDVESGSLHLADYATFLVAKKRYQKLEQNEATALKAFSPDEIEKIEKELDTLEKDELLNAKEQIYSIPFSGEVKALCLNICHDCNLRCPYCFAHEGTYNTPKDYMSFEVGAKAIDFLIAKSGTRHNLEVDFFGGEPLMNFETIKKIVYYAKEATKRANKKIDFTMTTNGVLLDSEKREWLNEHMFNTVISIDGRKEVHDALRVTPNKSGSHDITLKNALEFRKIRGNKSYYIRGTFTKNNLDFCKDVLFLNDCGFDQISLEPVVLDCLEPLAIGKDDLEKVFQQYDELAEQYITRRKGEKWFNFFHFMLDLEDGPCITKRLKGCGAGNEYLAITPLGDIYPCHQFATDEAFKMGNVLDDEFDCKKQQQFFKSSIYTKEHCNDCIAKYYCSGGCLANSYHFAGGIDNQYEVSCEMMRKRFMVSLAIYAYEKIHSSTHNA